MNVGKTTDGSFDIQVDNLEVFVINYINFWMKARGAGHYKFINEIMYTLYSKDLFKNSIKLDGFVFNDIEILTNVTKVTTI